MEYQKQGRHAEALELAGHLLRENPALGQQSFFRAFVGKSEKVWRGSGSILPPRKRSLWTLFQGGGGNRPASWQRTALFWVGGIALVLGGLATFNEYIRRHRTLFVVNACGNPVIVRVDNGSAQTVTDLGRLTVTEGRHHLTMSGPVTDTQDIDVQAGYFERFIKNPVWVVNPGSEAVLEEETLYYAEHPRPSQSRLIVGQAFLTRPHINYLFEPSPDKVEVKGKNAEVVKTSIKWWHGDDTRAFETALDENRSAALAFAESRLRRHPDNAALLKAYLNDSGEPELPRIKTLLKSELARRPVVVPWHRAYQSLSEFDPRNDTLAVYDGFLKAEPSSGALMYLRGRIEPDWEQQGRLYRQATVADPRLPWPWMALGKREIAAANWDESLRDLKKASDLKIDEDDIRDELVAARIATGQAKAMVTEYRKTVASRPFDFTAVVFLCESLAASGAPDAIVPELNNWEKLVRNSVPPNVLVQFRAIGLYCAGKLAECEDHCRRNPALQSSVYRAQTLLALKRSREVVSDKSFDKLLDHPWTALAVSLGLSLDGQREEASRFRERAIERMKSSFLPMRQVATVLGAAKPATDSDLLRIILDPEMKALVFAVLAERFPAKRADYLASAAQFNVRRKIPYQVVRRAISGPKSESQKPKA